jgi:hypothetical protein
MSVKAQVLLCVAILLVFGCLGMEAIDRQAWYPQSLPSGVVQLLLGIFLFWWSQQTSWRAPPGVFGVSFLSAGTLLGLMLLTLALSIPRSLAGAVWVRLGLASVIVCGRRFLRRDFPARAMGWLCFVGEIVLVWLFLLTLTAGFYFCFPPFYRSSIRFAHTVSFPLAETLAWSFVFVLAWFTHWLSKKPEDPVRLCGYWGMVGLCCTSVLHWHLPGISAVLLGSGTAGAAGALCLVPRQRRKRSLLVQATCVGGVVLLLVGTVWLFFPDGFERIRGFVFAEANRFSSGYLYAKTDRLIKNIPFWSGVPDFFDTVDTLPDYWRGMFLITTAALWGWYSTVIFLSVSLWLSWLLIEMVRRIGDPGIRAAVGVLTGAILLQTVCGVLQNAGWIPMLNLRLPFSDHRVLPFCVNALFLGVLFRFVTTEAPTENVSIWSQLFVPLAVIVVGGGLFGLRLFEHGNCRRDILVRQTHLLQQSLAEVDGMLAAIEKRGDLGEYAVCRGVNRYSTLDDNVLGMASRLFAAGRKEEAIQRLGQAVAVIRRVQGKGDNEAVALVLNGYADFLDRAGYTEKALTYYREASEMLCRVKRREEPSVTRRAVCVRSVKRPSQASRKEICCGDVILSYDGVPVFDARQIINRTIRDERRPRDCVLLVLLRNGREEEIDLLTGSIGVGLESCWLKERQDGEAVGM